MRPAHRWGLAAVATALIMLAPYAGHLRPTSDPAIGTADLVTAVRDPSAAAYSGTVDVQGSLGLPIADRFTDLADLFGGETRLRVWWRDSGDWRVDRLLETGEVDLFHQGPQTVEWSYERGEARACIDPAIRLPRDADLLPPEVAQRALDGVATSDVHRLPPRRIAGVDAAGLRIDITDDRSTLAGWTCGSTRPPAWCWRPRCTATARRPALSTAFTTVLGGRPRRRRDPFHPRRASRSSRRRRPRHRRRRQPVRAGRSRPHGGGPATRPRGHAAAVYGTRSDPGAGVPLPPREADDLAYRLAQSGARERPRPAPAPGRSARRDGDRLAAGRYGCAWLVAGTADRRGPPGRSVRPGHRGEAADDPDPGPDQALRPRRRRRRPRPGRRRGRRLRLPRRRTARARPRPSGCCSAWCSPTSGTDRGAGAADARGAPARCCPRSARWSRDPRRTPASVGPGEPRPARRHAGRRGARGDRAATGSTTPSTGSASVGSTGARSGRTRSACGSGSAWPRRCSAGRGCSSSTSRPTASTPRASARSATCCSSCNRGGHHGLPVLATCWPRSSSCATASGSSTAAGWCVQERLDALRGRPAGCACARRTSTGARSLLDGQVELVDGEELLVRHADAADAEPPAGRGRACGSRAGAGAAHARGRRARGAPAPGRTGWRAMIAVELRKLVRSRRTWVTIAVIDALPDAGRGAARRHRPRAAARHRARRSSPRC